MAKSNVSKTPLPKWPVWFDSGVRGFCDMMGYPYTLDSEGKIYISVPLDELNDCHLRDFTNDPIVQEKLDNYIKSIQNQGLWGRRLQAYIDNDVPCLRIPYGHHIKRAAIAVLGGQYCTEVELIENTPFVVMQRFVSENSPVKNTANTQWCHAVRLILESHASGLLPVTKSGLKPSNTLISFQFPFIVVKGKGKSCQYTPTAKSMADFMTCSISHVNNAYDLLEYADVVNLDPGVWDGLSTNMCKNIKNAVTRSVAELTPAIGKGAWNKTRVLIGKMPLTEESDMSQDEIEREWVADYITYWTDAVRKESSTFADVERWEYARKHGARAMKNKAAAAVKNSKSNVVSMSPVSRPLGGGSKQKGHIKPVLPKKQKAGTPGQLAKAINQSKLIERLEALETELIKNGVASCDRPGYTKLCDYLDRLTDCYYAIKNL